MHFRGSRMMLEAIHPDGRREVLTDATHYEQNWQITYKYKTPHLFPAGTILHTVSWHDNTANNKHNPDPTAWIGWGSRTMDEMGHGWTDIAFLTRRAVSGGVDQAQDVTANDDDTATTLGFQELRELLVSYLTVTESSHNQESHAATLRDTHTGSSLGSGPTNRQV